MNENCNWCVVGFSEIWLNTAVKEKGAQVYPESESYFKSQVVTLCKGFASCALQLILPLTTNSFVGQEILNTVCHKQTTHFCNRMVRKKTFCFWWNCEFSDLDVRLCVNHFNSWLEVNEVGK